MQYVLLKVVRNCTKFLASHPALLLQGNGGLFGNPAIKKNKDFVSFKQLLNDLIVE
jgi:hypothetical protein